MTIEVKYVTSEILSDGRQAELYRMTNSTGFSVDITNIGGAVVAVSAPDKDGELADVVLGFDSLKEYENNPSCFGVIVGRYANRISQAKIILDTQEFELTRNFGKHHIHGGYKGFQNKIWALKKNHEKGMKGINLYYVSEDGEEGYPGKLSVTVRYRITEENDLIIDYNAITDKKTVLNLTNHSFFNLSGAGNGNILNHIVKLNADAFTPVSDEWGIPTGEIRSVSDTPLDFRQRTRIGDRIDSNYQQIQYGKGYDQNFVLNGTGSERGAVAKVTEPGSGRVLEVYTTEPGLQFYTGNFLDGSDVGKGGTPYNKRDGFCLEAQHFPDSPNRPEFPSTVLNQGERFQSRTMYKFSTI